MTSEQNEEGEQRGLGEPITARGVEHPHDSLQFAETSAYCIGYNDPTLAAEALARAGGNPAAVEPDEAWETEDAVSRAEAEQLALTRWRDLGVPITVYERVGYREFPHADPELAAAGVTGCAWDDTVARATVMAGQLVPFV